MPPAHSTCLLRHSSLLPEYIPFEGMDDIDWTALDSQNVGGDGDGDDGEANEAGDKGGVDAMSDGSSTHRGYTGGRGDFDCIQKHGEFPLLKHGGPTDDGHGNGAVSFACAKSAVAPDLIYKRTRCVWT